MSSICKIPASLCTIVGAQVMQVVKSLTQGANSITVCATIHSPSAYTFRLFDRLLILLRGRSVYFGTVGTFRTTCLLTRRMDACL